MGHSQESFGHLEGGGRAQNRPSMPLTPSQRVTPSEKVIFDHLYSAVSALPRRWLSLVLPLRPCSPPVPCLPSLPSVFCYVSPLAGGGGGGGFCHQIFAFWTCPILAQAFTQSWARTKKKTNPDVFRTTGQPGPSLIAGPSNMHANVQGRGDILASAQLA